MANPNKEICENIYKAHKEVLDEIFVAVKGVLPKEPRDRVNKGGVSLADLVSKGLLSPADTLHGDYTQLQYVAHVKQLAGDEVGISYDGKDFESPSAAAKSITKREINGWTFWYAKDANGQPKGSLAELREKYLAMGEGQ